jgi:geranylgeranyl diphosphate synthase, type I
MIEPSAYDAALARALQRYAGTSPATAQIAHHLALGSPSAERRAMRALVAAGSAEGADPRALLDVACAGEFLAAHVILHEDVTRRTRERAGTPTVFAIDGLAHGINAGDTLAALAFLHLLDVAADAPERSFARALRFQRAIREASAVWSVGVLAGEVARPASTDAIVIGLSCALGASLAGADEERVDAYERFGRALCLADASSVATLVASGIDAAGEVRAVLGVPREAMR